MDTISRLFSPSPFPSFQSQAGAVLAYLWRLEQLGSAVQAGRVSDVARLRAELTELFSQACDAGAFVLDAIKQGHLFPAGRERLIAVEDDTQLVLEAAQELADLLLRRPVGTPEGIDPSMLRLVRDATEMACLPVELVRRLRRFVQFGMGGPEMDSMTILLSDARSEKVRIQAAKTELECQLSQSEDALQPLSVIHLWDVLRALGRLVARAGRLTDHLDLLLVGGDASRVLSATKSDESRHHVKSKPRSDHVDWRDAEWTAEVVSDRAACSTSGR